jgi:rSAM/selenodomain-associated transferase 2
MRWRVVVPMLNEAAGIAGTLQALAAWRARGHEVVVVDGGSTDGSVEQAGPLAEVVLAGPRGRARQMNAGARWQRAGGAQPPQALLFLHADTRLPPDAEAAATAALAGGAAWGRFDVRIVAPPGQRRPWMLGVVGTAMNWRSRLSGIATGDQALFVRADVFAELGGFADQPLMEDIEFSRRFGHFAGPPACLRQRVGTSGRRWIEHGVWRTIVLMWRLRWRYWRGADPSTLAREYR